MRQMDIEAGWYSERGSRPDNQDFAAACLGTATQRAQFGVVAAIADGVGGHMAGRVAAETAVRAFIDFYLGQRDTLGARRAMARSAEAVNGWIHGQGRTDPACAGMAATLTAVVLRHRTLHVLHAGDTRLYRLRAGVLTVLTTDHVHEAPGQQHVLRRAIGLEDALRADYAAENLAEGDRLLLTSDGVHGALRHGAIARLLHQEQSPALAAQALVRAASAAAGHDNATALVLDVLALPPTTQEELSHEAAALPLRPAPRQGETIDSYRLDQVLSDGRANIVFAATDLLASPVSPLVLKFPKPEAVADAGHRAAFIREGWVCARVRSPWLIEAAEPEPGRRTCLYSAWRHYAGETLAERLRRPPQIGLAEGLRIGAGLAKGVAVLHRAGIVHRDIKPENVILVDGAAPRLMDFGSVRLPGAEPDGDEGAAAPGTPSYMAPELLAGAPGDERSDIFALGVTLYRMFTGAYPYGEIEPFQRPTFKPAPPLQQARPDLPFWLDRALSRAIAAAPQDRQGDAIELALELEGGASRPGPALRRTPLLAQNPAAFWRLASIVLLLLLLLSALLRR